MGGKSNLTKEIIPLIPPHIAFVEVFCGAAWLLFRKPRSPIEFINDIDNELINLYLVIKKDPYNFFKELCNFPISEFLYNEFVRAGHEWYTSKALQGIPTMDHEMHKSNSGVDGIPCMSSAIRTYYILMNSFNGNLRRKPYFDVDKNRRSGFTKIYKTDWYAVSERLKTVTILNKDYKDVIRLLDGPETLFYLDPPYHLATESKQYYRYTFSDKDHEELKVCLSDIKGKFILSYQDNEIVREIYSEYNLIASKYYPEELLILNFTPPEKPFYISCREGIPSPDRVNNDNGDPNKACLDDHDKVDIAKAYQDSSNINGSWKSPNCPYCESRKIKYSYERITKTNGKRLYIHCGYKCKTCNRVFN